MSYIVGLLAFLTVVQSIKNHQFASREKQICAKYPFYTMRDRVVMAMIDDPNTAKDRLQLYHRTNKVISNLHILNFKIIAQIIDSIITDFLLDRDYSVEEKHTNFHVEFAYIVLQTARKNSILARLVLSHSRLGRMIVSGIALKSIIRVLREKSTRAKALETMQKLDDRLPRHKSHREQFAPTG